MDGFDTREQPCDFESMVRKFEWRSQDCIDECFKIAQQRAEMENAVRLNGLQQKFKKNYLEFSGMMRAKFGFENGMEAENRLWTELDTALSGTTQM